MTPKHPLGPPMTLGNMREPSGPFTSFPPSRRVRFAPRVDANTRVYEYTPSCSGAPVLFPVWPHVHALAAVIWRTWREDGT